MTYARQAPWDRYGFDRETSDGRHLKVWVIDLLDVLEDLEGTVWSFTKNALVMAMHDVPEDCRHTCKLVFDRGGYEDATMARLVWVVPETDKEMAERLAETVVAQAAAQAETEAKERALLARLKAQYEGTT